MPLAQPAELITAAPPRRPRALRLVKSDLRRMPRLGAAARDGVRPLLVAGDWVPP